MMLVVIRYTLLRWSRRRTDKGRQSDARWAVALPCQDSAKHAARQWRRRQDFYSTYPSNDDVYMKNVGGSHCYILFLRPRIMSPCSEKRS